MHLKVFIKLYLLLFGQLLPINSEKHIISLVGYVFRLDKCEN